MSIKHVDLKDAMKLAPDLPDITELDALKVGDLIWIPGLMGEWRQAEVTAVDRERRTAGADSSTFLFNLEFTGQGWRCSAMGNKAALDKIELI